MKDEETYNSFEINNKTETYNNKELCECFT